MEPIEVETIMRPITHQRSRPQWYSVILSIIVNIDNNIPPLFNNKRWKMQEEFRTTNSNEAYLVYNEMLNNLDSTKDIKLNIYAQHLNNRYTLENLIIKK
jgi:hypothetical protein